jgi:CheY-like chemotaxis protein
MLESLGHGVQVADDARAGVEAYRASPQAFDLILMDMTTPRLSAEQALQRLLEIDAEARVVVCSGYAAGTESQRLLEAGAKAFLQKPYRLEQLDAVLRRL